MADTDLAYHFLGTLMLVHTPLLFCICRSYYHNDRKRKSDHYSHDRRSKEVRLDYVPKDPRDHRPVDGGGGSYRSTPDMHSDNSREPPDYYAAAAAAAADPRTTPLHLKH